MNLSILRFKKILFLLLNIKYLFIFIFNNSVPSIEHKLALKSLKGIRTIIDVGGNKGQFSLYAKYLFPNSKIFIFEPLQKEFKTLKKIFKKDKTVHLYNYALGETKQRKNFYITSARDSSSFLKPNDNLENTTLIKKISKIIKVDILSIDSIINYKELKNKTLLKIDVQGFELNVLKGAINLINYVEYIYIECSFI